MQSQRRRAHLTVMGILRMFLVGAAVATAACNFSLHSSSSFSGSSTGPSASDAPAASSTPSAPAAEAAPVAASSGPSKGIPASAPVEPEPDPGFEKLAPPAMPAGPAPKVTIVSPSSDQELFGTKTRAPDDKFENLDCLQDAKTFSIKVAAQNWNVSPGGPGVLVVVDGVYATVTHDLSKPIMVADLEPYERVDNNATYAVQGPMYACGEHWIAAVPTAANGQMLPVAPTVSWFFNRSKNYHTDPESADQKQVRLYFHLPVINWPLIGPIHIGTGWRFGEGARSGRIARDPKRIVLDWTLARGTSTDPCRLILGHQTGAQSMRYDMVQIPTHGTVVVPNDYTDGAMLISASKCGGMSEYIAKIWTQPPPAPRHAWKWPVPGSAEAENFWNSDEGQAAFARSQAAGASSGSHDSGGGGGKCKSQCTVQAGQCRTSCKGAKCANDCNKSEKACKAGC